MHFFTSSQCFWMVLTLQNLKLGRNLEVSWYSCNILRYCSNRCIVWFFIPANCPAQANRKFPVQLYVKIQILFEPSFWICKWANHLSFQAMLCQALPCWTLRILYQLQNISQCFLVITFMNTIDSYISFPFLVYIPHSAYEHIVNLSLFFKCRRFYWRHDPWRIIWIW